MRRTRDRATEVISALVCRIYLVAGAVLQERQRRFKAADDKAGAKSAAVGSTATFAPRAIALAIADACGSLPNFARQQRAATLKSRLG